MNPLNPDYSACRYGDFWAPRRRVSSGVVKEGGNETLVLEEGEEILGISGYSEELHGYTLSLVVTTSQQEWGPWGVHSQEPGTRRSLRSSPAISGIRLTHMTGDTAEDAIKLRFHWAAPRIRV